MTSLMKALLDAGYQRSEMDHHESDLYVYATPLASFVIESWCKENGINREHFCLKFKCNITGREMYDCAFQWNDDLR